MNLSITDELQLFSKELQRNMSPHALEQLARKVPLLCFKCANYKEAIQYLE